MSGTGRPPCNSGMHSKDCSAQRVHVGVWRVPLEESGFLDNFVLLTEDIGEGLWACTSESALGFKPFSNKDGASRTSSALSRDLNQQPLRSYWVIDNALSSNSLIAIPPLGLVYPWDLCIDVL